MIVKFDHISYSCDYDKACKQIFEGYKEEFSESNLRNLEIKKSLLNLQSPEHAIRMLSSKIGYPIEITFYPHCISNGKKFELSEDEIKIYTIDCEKTTSFFLNIGFKQLENGLLELRTILDKKKLLIQIISDNKAAKTWYLDNEGFGSLAFVVDNIEKQKRQLEEKNIYVTDIQELYVNGKDLDIFFAVGEMGEIIEFIGLKRCGSRNEGY